MSSDAIAPPIKGQIFHSPLCDKIISSSDTNTFSVSAQLSTSPLTQKACTTSNGTNTFSISTQLPTSPLMQKACTYTTVHASVHTPTVNTTECSNSIFDKQPSDLLYVCTFCHNTVQRQLSVQFVKHNYDFNNSIICKALSSDIRYRHEGMGEFICKNCHRKLHKLNTTPVMPCEAVASPSKGTFQCLLCDNTQPRRSAREFDEKNYNCDNDNVKKALATIMVKSSLHWKPHICNRCHNNLLRYSIVKCTNCLSKVGRQYAVIFNKSKYLSESTIKSHDISNSSHHGTMHICKKCHADLSGSIVCVCCQRNMKRKSAVLFKNKTMIMKSLL